MNRATVVFIALAILFAHILAIHQYPDGDFAAPYDSAHVAYRIGRNLVHQGRALWDPQGVWAESYPSTLWIWVAAAAERAYMPPTLVAQWVGILCTLCTVVVMAQFSPTRLAGLIAPVLLATSGGAAAAAASGTEAPVAMLLASVAFLAFERGWRRLLALSLTVLILTRPEGAPFVAAVAALELADRPKRPSGVRRSSLVRSILFLPLIPLVLLCLQRYVASGNLLSPFAAETVGVAPERWLLGFHYLLSFVYASGSGPLLALPVLLLLLGHLTAMGRRALLLFLVWAAVVGFSGGDHLPFWNALAPALPLLFIAIQSAFTQWMDWVPRQAPLAWFLLMTAFAASFLVSRNPDDLGPIPMEGAMRAWMEPTPVLHRAYEKQLGRIGLTDEINFVERLRPLGVFLRDNVSADATIATYWPGAIGYLSRKRTFDLLGRTEALPDARRSHSWRGLPRIDLVRAFEREADYLVPLVGNLEQSTAPSEFLRFWLRRYDVVGDTDERAAELLAFLRKYEFVALPVLEKDYVPDAPSVVPFLLLRHKGLGISPKLDIRIEDGEFEVLLRHVGHQQVVDLNVILIDENQETWSLRPTGEWVQGGGTDARTDILVYDTGQRPVQLMKARLPEVEAIWLSARLHNPGVPPGTPLSQVGEAFNVRL